MTHQHLTNTHPGQKGLQRSGELLCDMVDEILTRALQLLVDVSLRVDEQFCHLGSALSTQNTCCTSPGLQSASHGGIFGGLSYQNFSIHRDSVEAHEPLRVLLTVATLTLELLASLWTPTEVTVFFHGSKGNLKKCY